MLASAGSDIEGSPNGAADNCFDAAEAVPPIGFIHVGIVPVALGADLDTLATEADLEPRLFDDSSGFVPFTALSRLVALTADHACWPHLGLLIGQHTTLTSLGPLLRNANTLGDALRALEARLWVRNRGAEIVLDVHDHIAALSYVLHEPEIGGAPHQLECGLAQATNLTRALCSPDWAPLEVLLPRSALRDPAPIRGFFRAPVRFDQEGAALVFEAQLLDEGIVGADPAVRQRVEDRIRQLEAMEPSSLTDDLRHHLRIMVMRQSCRAERIARQRRVTRRTLSRRLRAEGTTFTQVADEARFRVAKQLMADTAMSLTQISVALNFSEPAAFSMPSGAGQAWHRARGDGRTGLWRKVMSHGNNTTQARRGTEDASALSRLGLWPRDVRVRSGRSGGPLVAY